MVGRRKECVDGEKRKEREREKKKRSFVDNQN